VPDEPKKLGQLQDSAPVTSEQPLAPAAPGHDETKFVNEPPPLASDAMKQLVGLLLGLLK